MLTPERQIPDTSYIRIKMLLRQQIYRSNNQTAKEPACINKVLNLADKQKEKNSYKIMNLMIRFAIAVHLVNNQNCAESINQEKYKIIKRLL